ncbi:MAG: hypothetical protein EOM24_29480, partial [Chloroflexia bacterium]|nr:hypothetical protein [Chloroflexia bacterium]
MSDPGFTSRESEETRRDQRRRDTLAGYLNQLLAQLHALQLSDEHTNALNLLQVINRDTFKLLIMGEFKTGKSTFINALLREKVLPSYATPTTAIINEVKYGAQRRALLHFNDEDKQPMEIPVDQLEEYV